MEDNHLLNRIKHLTETEQHLWEKDLLSDEETRQIHEIKLELDQCWDYLRQRKALRDADMNPDKADPRDIDTIRNDQR